MRIVIPSVQVPFVRGGAALMTQGLKRALEDAGHDVEIVTFPFKFSPIDELLSLMQYSQSVDFEWFTGYHIDRVITLQFPAYYVPHAHKTLWLMHQHRAAYELYNEAMADAATKRFMQQIRKTDTKLLGMINRRFAMSGNVAGRLDRFNGLKATPIYHPPPLAGEYHSAEAFDFVFYPSRLEELKRQDLLIRAASLMQSPLKVLLAGAGGQQSQYERLIHQLGLHDRVRILGEVSDVELVEYFAHATAVFFGPWSEDYGYVTLEAMLSCKPVVTCTDSGGPLEFVEDRVTGYVVEPDPQQIAAVLDELYSSRQLTRKLGRRGFEKYQSMNISWQHVVETLVDE
jgi:glycosyltransferase involved in cell wall biosynthesis